ncbi:MULTISPECIES: hypothetical protein [Brevibacillus]|uniref:Uncharacterized protein n=1 Tax=Brevibacillus borstelensis AK1 TaxID=1300222 RepID=M8DCN2_9BACL|nr:hypothetical protein [Brevibacillus borstelensis]EMT51112.1 hypothetical protein I532_19387 [Brevibacillus borstelensis AK1]MBE5394495.1 hypothetical protein [Brevibacillus borstelensis]MCC0566087.1 hypothetical protein [Brevibacillus borstelensis]MCM3472705.1 hypothetical protein [Brevibacillus borstelensis]MCM3560887.1 hypothetical protein [Brevibacillus borstelensis]
MIATRFITHNVFGFLAILLISHLPLSPFLGVLLVSIIWMVSAAFFTMDYKETKQIKGIVLAALTLYVIMDLLVLITLLEN